MLSEIEPQKKLTAADHLLALCVAVAKSLDESLIESDDIARAQEELKKALRRSMTFIESGGA